MSISSVTSEALQLKLRQLLPSQRGFDTDISASDTIIPIIDLTSAAEGSDVGQNLQTAIAFGSQTEFSASNATDVIANTAGFYRIIGTATAIRNHACSLTMTDGVSVKTVWAMKYNSGAVSAAISENIDLVVFLRTGDSVSAVSADADNVIQGSSRQIADVNGTLVQPVGFTPQ